jgi:23S rRNA pseudouridine1911/1915/1917 synthase
VTEPGAPAVALVAAPGDPLDRLDKLVVALLARAGTVASRSQVQRWIEAGRVTVDGRPGRVSEAVRAGAAIEVRPLPPEAPSAAPDASVTFEVLHEDAHLVVLDKPPHLVVHPARGHASGTLVNGLLATGSFDRAGADPRDPMGKLRPGIVHRLDKGTSGVLVVAKDEPTREGLKALFARHDIDRAYVAIVVGSANDATWDTPHGRHPTDRLRFTTRVREGKRAITHVRVLERLAGDRATLVECRLETGRTHQIRVHLAERGGTPILGDPLYAKTPRDPALAAIGAELGRQALHARLLGFVHPVTGEALRFEREPPADFQRALAELRAL